MFNKAALKQDLKALAVLIHKQKEDLKECQRRTGKDFEEIAGSSAFQCYGVLALKSKHEFRHKHIAYCLLRGRTMEQIEKPGKYNQPNMEIVERIKNEYNLDNVCASAA